MASLARSLLGAFLYFPSSRIEQTPADAGLEFSELELGTADGERLHAWWIRAASGSLGHVLFFHGNAGNVGDRVANAALLGAAGFDVLLFDYRGYGRSSGRPDEAGTYRDARVARSALFAQPAVESERVFYLGESLGAAVALNLALEHPPAGLILQSGFTGVRDVARVHYPFLPPPLVPDAYPSLRLIRALCSPLLVLHGDRDDIVPLDHGRALFDAAPEPKRIHVFQGLGHNDLVPLAGPTYAEVISDWARDLREAKPPAG